LDSNAAIAAAPKIAQTLADKLKRGQDWIEHQLQLFQAVAEHYVLKRG
jgi:phenylacetate-coenzyme A ligase PaaK-like adenylate-forming protein